MLFLLYEAYRKELSWSWKALAYVIQSVAMLYQAHIIDSDAGILALEPSPILANAIYYKKNEMNTNCVVNLNNTETKSE